MTQDIMVQLDLTTPGAHGLFPQSRVTYMYPTKIALVPTPQSTIVGICNTSRANDSPNAIAAVDCETHMQRNESTRQTRSALILNADKDL